MYDIKGIGTIYRDTILTIPHFPTEDSKLQATTLNSRIGGNVFNSLSVLAQIRRSESESLVLEFVGALCAENEAGPVKDAFRRIGVVPDLIFRDGCHKVPEAYILESKRDNTRTIVFKLTRGIVVYHSVDDLNAQELRDRLVYEGPPREHDPMEWIHAEGRNCDVLYSVLGEAYPRTDKTTRISVDFEKPERPGLRQLFQIVDVAFVSRAYAAFLATDHLQEENRPLTNELVIRGMLKEIGREINPSAVGYVTLGSDGCYLFWNRNYYHEILRDIESGFWQNDWFFIHLPAPVLPGDIVETTGAGDAFIAGALACRALWERGPGIVEAGILGNLIAGRKCRRRGYEGLWGDSLLERILRIVTTDA